MREGIDEVDPSIQGAICMGGDDCEFAEENANIFAFLMPKDGKNYLTVKRKCVKIPKNVEISTIAVQTKKKQKTICFGT